VLRLLLLQCVRYRSVTRIITTRCRTAQYCDTATWCSPFCLAARCHGNHWQQLNQQLQQQQQQCTSDLVARTALTSDLKVVNCDLWKDAWRCCREWNGRRYQPTHLTNCCSQSYHTTNTHEHAYLNCQSEIQKFKLTPVLVHLCNHKGGLKLGLISCTCLSGPGFKMPFWASVYSRCVTGLISWAVTVGSPVSSPLNYNRLSECFAICYWQLCKEGWAWSVSTWLKNTSVWVTLRLV